MKKPWLKSWLAVLALTTLVGCLTPADQWLSQNLTPKEKADLMADRGLIQYTKMLEADALADASKIRTLLQTALTADPTNTKAADLQKRLDQYLAKRQGDATSKAKAIAAKGPVTLNDKDRLELVTAYDDWKVLSPSDPELAKLDAAVSAARQELIKKDLQVILDYEKALTSVRVDAAAAKILSSIHESILVLQAIDPQNAEAKAAAERLKATIAERSKADMALAQKAYASKDYSGATKVLNRVSQTQVGVGGSESQEVNDLQYKVAFDWAKDLFAAKKYGEAASRVADALSASTTSEALELKDKIAKAASTRDYDAEYDAIDKQLEGLVKNGDLRTAWTLVLTTTPQLKKDETKSRVAARKKQILDAARALYDSAVASYNDEDYQEAKLNFDIVVAIDPTYQSAKAYQDKAKAKLAALGGR